MFTCLKYNLFIPKYKFLLFLLSLIFLLFLADFYVFHFRILYKYYYGGNFKASADVFNPVSRVSKSEALLVSDSDYQLPLVWIDENSTDVSNPLKVSDVLPLHCLLFNLREH